MNNFQLNSSNVEPDTGISEYWAIWVLPKPFNIEDLVHTGEAPPHANKVENMIDIIKVTPSRILQLQWKGYVSRTAPYRERSILIL